MPQFITHRHFHSVSLFPVSQYCVYCILFGGVKEWVQTEPTSNQPILSDTIIIEMCKFVLFQLINFTISL